MIRANHEVTGKAKEENYHYQASPLGLDGKCFEGPDPNAPLADVEQKVAEEAHHWIHDTILPQHAYVDDDRGKAGDHVDEPLIDESFYIIGHHLSIEFCFCSFDGDFIFNIDNFEINQ